jgi:TfoX/Sxy family transcriptional regulator of competence genes
VFLRNSAGRRRGILAGMAYDEELAERVREELQADPALSERKMFGGLCFMLHGNMCAGVVGERLMLRLGGPAAEAALREPHVSPMDFTGRPMKGMVYVEAEGLAGRALARWVEQAAAHARSLPAKGAATAR